MISLECPIPGCGYSTPESSEVVACALLAAHTPVHTAPSLMSNVGPANGPKLERPKVDIGINKEEWNIFERRWDAFVIGSRFNLDNCSFQLFQICSSNLILPSYQNQPASLRRP